MCCTWLYKYCNYFSPLYMYGNLSVSMEVSDMIQSTLSLPDVGIRHA